MYTAPSGKQYPDSMKELIEFYGEPISTYTREQAIEDGFLIDLNQIIPQNESGFNAPIACTPQVWAVIERTAKGPHHDAHGITWDILWLMRSYYKQESDNARVFRVKIGRQYQYFRAIADGDGITIKLQSE